MVFYFIGLLMIFVGLLYFFFPSKTKETRYGYRTPRALFTQQTYEYSQKIASRVLFLIGLMTFLIGYTLRLTGLTSLFLLEIILISIPMIATVYHIEKRIERFNDEVEKEIMMNQQKKENEYETIND